MLKKLFCILCVITIAFSMMCVDGATVKEYEGDVNIVEPRAMEDKVSGLISDENGVKTFALTLLHEGGFPKNKEYSEVLFKDSEKISKALFEKKTEIKIETREDAEKLADVYEWIVNAEPELFYVEDIVKIKEDENSLIIYPQYKDEGSLLAFDSGKEFKEEVKRILSCVTDDMTDLEKALAVHDYFARFYEYDYSYSRSGIEQIFRDKKGVCQAYADGYTYIMQEKLGVECYTISSDALNHAWNVIKIDGDWYHVDITHDDPNFNGKDHFGNARHVNFLVSSDTIRDEGHKHNSYDWEICGYTEYMYGFKVPNKLVEPTSKKFENYVWSKTGYSPFIYYEGEWYYTYLGYLYKYDVNKNQSTDVMELDCYNSSNYDTFDIYEDTVFFKYYWSEVRFGEHTTYMHPMKGYGKRQVYSLDGVYSFRVNGDKLEYIKYSNYYGGIQGTLDLTKLEYKVKAPIITVEKDYCEAYFDCETDDVEFYYTMDGTNPTLESDSCDFIMYDEVDSFELRVIAAKEGYNNSDVATVFINDGPRIEYITTWKENGKTYLEVHVNKAPENAVVYAVAYDGNDVISELHKLPVIDGVATGEFGANNVYMYKALLWENNSMMPLAVSKEY